MLISGEHNFFIQLEGYAANTTHKIIRSKSAESRKKLAQSESWVLILLHLLSRIFVSRITLQIMFCQTPTWRDRVWLRLRKNSITYYSTVQRHWWPRGTFLGLDTWTCLDPLESTCSGNKCSSKSNEIYHRLADYKRRYIDDRMRKLIYPSHHIDRIEEWLTQVFSWRNYLEYPTSRSRLSVMLR